jgi:lysophospholipase L1-like esterase
MSLGWPSTSRRCAQVWLLAGLVLSGLGCGAPRAYAAPDEAPDGPASPAIDPGTGGGDRGRATIAATTDPTAERAGVSGGAEASPLPREDLIASLGAAVPMDDATGDAFAPVKRALDAAVARKGKGPEHQLRVAFYGASHTAADVWTGELRRQLQHRYGDAGHGFILPVRWHGGYRGADINIRYSRGWHVRRHKLLNPIKIGDYGYLGVAVSSDDPEQYAEAFTCTDNRCGRRADTIEVWLRHGPEAGKTRVIIDGKEHVIDTLAETREVRFHRWELADRGHKVRVQPLQGETYLYGVVLDRQTPGVIVDQLGIPGMRGSIQLHWQEGPWRVQLQRRRPDLVVLAYGTNAVGDRGPIRDFIERWRGVLERIRVAVPGAACMIVGPTDRPLRPNDEGERLFRPRTTAVITAQRAVAAEFGCSYWDAFAAMGGPGSMNRWVDAELAKRDYVHLNREGYFRLSHLMLEALLTAVGRQADLANPGPYPLGVPQDAR